MRWYGGLEKDCCMEENQINLYVFPVYPGVTTLSLHHLHAWKLETPEQTEYFEEKIRYHFPFNQLFSWAFWQMSLVDNIYKRNI